MIEAKEFFIAHDHICYIDENNDLWGAGRLPHISPKQTHVWKHIDSNVISYSSYSVENLSSATEDLHAIYIKSDGSVWGCGENNYGRLGEDIPTKQFCPLKGPWQKNGHIPIAVSTGIAHSLILTDAGVLYGTGSNAQGQLGQIQRVSSIQRWAEIPTEGKIAHIYTGPHHSFLITHKGAVLTAGNNTYGQLGREGISVFPWRDVLPFVEEIVKIATCATHTLLLTKNGHVWFAGTEECFDKATNIFIKIKDAEDIVDIAAQASKEAENAIPLTYLVAAKSAQLYVLEGGRLNYYASNVANVWAGPNAYTTRPHRTIFAPYSCYGIARNKYGQLGLNFVNDAPSGGNLVFGPCLDIMSQILPEGFPVTIYPTSKEYYTLQQEKHPFKKFRFYSPFDLAGYCMAIKGGMQ